MHPLRSILPLALFTAVGLLATDLYLPAVPSLPQQLGGSIESAQATLAAFSAALAVSQLVWGAAADRFGHRRTLAFAVLLQLVAGAACALAPSMGALIGARLAQGFGVGAAMVIVPALVRQSFGDGGAVRALAWLGIVESAVPGLAPLVGAALLVVADWRTSFWIIVALSAIAAPLVFRVIPTARAMRACAPANVGAHAGGYRRLLRSPVYLGYALGHALCFAALLAFVASAPQVVEIWLGAGPSTFSLMQACGVAAFMLSAARSGKWSDALGLDRIIALGALLQFAASAAFLLLAYADWRSTPLVVASWMLFCGSLGLRGPASMARALAAEPAVAGRAAGLLMFFGLGGAALATQAVAPFLRLGLAPVAWMCAGFTLASGAVVLWGIAIRDRHRAAATETA
ncbi:major facilitator family transporter [Burkholderia pseudomallei]|uniref:MFS transporter n=1 Tax=Burkholderia pseudomallei TaxID=28450 RepID=UPI0005313092|nr:MFS transporter [Burkholderia pseudomallei]KGS85960.1 sugar (and other) transporter family protein [Burkholderia pseudomallei MSHR5596]KGU75284.1 sugar (and other) transporter family protein [Burkholderia pseudomallei MSHR4304]KGV38557.1 sugar (and other) transporter family protein [Burkholderia pseudomallei MSHR4308]MBM5580927.1 MFS transporter [Burkholderia pseudomallei]MBM5583862.1 MFS transporter [Burkholderia pseudomallei]